MPFAVGKCYTQTHFLHFDLAFPRQFFFKKKYFVFFIKAKTLSLSLSLSLSSGEEQDVGGECRTQENGRTLKLVSARTVGSRLAGRDLAFLSQNGQIPTYWLGNGSSIVSRCIFFFF